MRVCVLVHMRMSMCIGVFVYACVRAYVRACECDYILYMCILSAKTSSTELQSLIAKYPRHVKINEMEKIKNKSEQLDIIRHLAIPMFGKRQLRCEYYLLQISRSCIALSRLHFSGR